MNFIPCRACGDAAAVNGYGEPKLLLAGGHSYCKDCFKELTEGKIKDPKFNPNKFWKVSLHA